MNPIPRGTKQLFDHSRELIELMFGPSSFIDEETEAQRTYAIPPELRRSGIRI